MQVREAISKILTGQIPELTAETPLQSMPGWDSLVMVRLVVLLEQELGRQIDDEEIERVETVGDVAKLLQAS